MDLPTLKHHRGVVKASLTKSLTFIKNVDKSTVGVSALRNRRLLTEQHFKRFEELQQNIEELTKDDDDEFDVQVAERDDVEAKFLDIVSLIDNIIEELTPQPTTNPLCGSGSGGGHAVVKLPRLDLPKFTGRYDEWASFMDLFESTIDRNTALSEVQKLQYLKSLVTDEAATIIKNLPVTSTNYNEAWTLLKNRYNNQREIVYSQVRRLFNIQQVKSNSASSIQLLLDLTNECIRALTVLKQPTEHWDTLIVHMTVDKLDSETKKQWALQLKGTDIPTYKDLCEFLEQYIRSLNACSGTAKATSSNDKKTTLAHFSSSNSVTKCVLCKTDHAIFKCTKFLDMSVKDRNETVKRNSLCFNCLKLNHKTVDCKSSSKCKVCNKQHNTLLHFTKHEQQQQANIPTSKDVTTSHHTHNDNTNVLLSTAVVRTKSNSGTWVDIRILLDGGSQGTIIRDECVKALGLRRSYDKTLIKGIGGTVAGYSKGKVSCRLYSKVYNEHIDVTAIVMGNVTKALPDFSINSNWHHLDGVKLADPNYYQKGPIDIILGNEYTMAIQLNGKIQGDGIKPYAQNTIFGWAVGGRISVQGANTVSIHHVHCEAESIIKRFWELEEIPQPKYLSAEERECERHFVETYTRNKEGRFCVQLPIKDNIKNLGYSRDIAINRLKQVERRLIRQPEYREEYNKFMSEAIKLGHMVRVPRGEDYEILGVTNYLCHHFVLKPESSTTKFRVVYDASAKTSSGVSLNDCLLVGPTIQNDIFTLLLKFRINKVALKADIAKMFRQFLVTDKDANLQRIVWREDPKKEVEDYRLTTITYGTASAPFQATRCLQQLALDNQKKYPLASKKLTDEIYIDDLIGSCENSEQAINIVNDLNNIATSAGLSFRKWSTNDQNVLSIIPDNMRELQASSFEKDNNIKALGVKWNPQSDTFCFGNVKYECSGRLTKRLVLSQLAKIFDPLGFVSPVTINAKLFIQQLWKDNLHWDERLSESLCVSWKRYCDQLKDIDKIKIRRWIKQNDTKTVQLHAFCDSSERAFGVVIYLRCESVNQTYSSYMVAAKSRVAPLKNITLPRLELCGAVLLAHTLCTVKKALNIDCDVFAWTDSMIVLQWLASYPGRWQTFVANRVAEIQERVPFERWNHVKSEENPADVVSRGISATELISSTLWWNGPTWLSSSELPPRAKISTTSHKDLEERKKSITFVAHIATDDEFLDTFSSLLKLKRVMAVILRFIDYCRKRTESKGPISPSELQRAEVKIISLVQLTSFFREIESLRNKELLSPKSKLLSLNPFLDENGILRVGGRLGKSNLPMTQKHPVILPHDSNFTKLLILESHKIHLHGGTKLVWSHLQQNYWILNARNKIRFTLRKCVVCRRNKAEQMSQLMGALPMSRVTPGRAFLHTGCDYAGPIQLRAMKDGRGKKLFKGYFCIFVCMATKAVHLEPVSDMTTEGFIQTLRRFVSRRGLPAVMYSDCGTNFAGADKELQRIIQDENRNNAVENELSQRGIEWKFNPPASPHHGGLWEAGVKSVKYHLRRVIGVRPITFEEFSTILCQVEACLNSRPLTGISNDPDDYEVLTPGHFLVGHALSAVPQQDLTDLKMNRLSRWEYTQQCFQHFWKRWRIEYLSTLQQRFKWKIKRDNLNVGDLVIINEDNVPPMKWKMGRVTELHHGVDGMVRVVTLKTASGELKRPIVKLTPLLLVDEQ